MSSVIESFVPLSHSLRNRDSGTSIPGSGQTAGHAAGQPNQIRPSGYSHPDKLRDKAGTAVSQRDRDPQFSASPTFAGVTGCEPSKHVRNELAERLKAEATKMAANGKPPGLLSGEEALKLIKQRLAALGIGEPETGDR